MKYAVKMSSGGTIHIPSLIEGDTQTQTECRLHKPIFIFSKYGKWAKNETRLMR
jgi:hypothetical protein